MLFDENWIDETSAICLRFSRVYNSTGAVRFGSGSNLFWLTIDQVIQLTIVWKKDSWSTRVKRQQEFQHVCEHKCLLEP